MRARDWVLKGRESEQPTPRVAEENCYIRSIRDRRSAVPIVFEMGSSVTCSCSCAFTCIVYLTCGVRSEQGHVGEDKRKVSIGCPIRLIRRISVLGMRGFLFLSLGFVGERKLMRD